MLHHVTTFTDFLLENERKHKRATGSFTFLLLQIESAAKIIASHVRESGLIDILGQTGKINSFSEEVQKLDEFSNNLLIELLTQSGQTYALISEEVEKPIITTPSHKGNYIVYFDPLDGSSNIDTSSPIGTIFSIYHKGNGLLQPGKAQVAAGYIIYGSSTILVYTNGESVNGFTLDPSIGSFLLSHPNIKTPESGTVYSINEAYYPLYDVSIQKYLSHVKTNKKSSLRYVGSMVADVHRTLLKGGLFLYPQDAKHKDGKLRLMLEANPMALLVKTSEGMAINNEGDILDTIPKHIHQQTSVILGSKENVIEFNKFLYDKKRI